MGRVFAASWVDLGRQLQESAQVPCALKVRPPKGAYHGRQHQLLAFRVIESIGACPNCLLTLNKV